MMLYVLRAFLVPFPDICDKSASGSIKKTETEKACPQDKPGGNKTTNLFPPKSFQQYRIILGAPKRLTPKKLSCCLNPFQKIIGVGTMMAMTVTDDDDDDGDNEE